jgi:hypothetical protein
MLIDRGADVKRLSTGRLGAFTRPDEQPSTMEPPEIDGRDPTLDEVARPSRKDDARLPR